jgi:molybdopterin-binding protein
MPPALNVKAIRTRLGVSQNELARLVGAHAMTVSKWERGVLKPSEHQARLLRAFRGAAERGVSVRERGKKSDPLRFLSDLLSHAHGQPELNLGTLSATNRFPGTVVQLSRGDVMSKVVVEVAPGLKIGAVITTDSIDRMGLEVGSRAIAIIKATEVILGGG